MPYSAPIRSALRTSISRDLHDATNAAFVAAEVNDLINSGIAELNLLAPKEYRDTLTLTAGVFEYALTPTVTALFRVEVWRAGAFYFVVPKKDDESISGWDYFAGTLLLPTTLNFDDSQDSLVVMGYKQRDPLTADGNVFDGDLNGEMVVRAYCQFSSFQRLIASRALFQQWQTQANNSDVSATQLLGMAQVYSREWKELRGRVRRLRRTG